MLEKKRGKSPFLPRQREKGGGGKKKEIVEKKGRGKTAICVVLTTCLGGEIKGKKPKKGGTKSWNNLAGPGGKRKGPGEGRGMVGFLGPGRGGGVKEREKRRRNRRRTKQREKKEKNRKRNGERGGASPNAFGDN